jgi:long-chain acyl-CoA synthetase
MGRRRLRRDVRGCRHLKKRIFAGAIAVGLKASQAKKDIFKVYGGERPYCIALVGLDAEAITEWAGKHGLGDKSFAEIARNEKTRELISGNIDTLNKHLDRWEQIKKFDIVDRELSVEADDLTPSMKLGARSRCAELHGRYRRP